MLYLNFYPMIKAIVCLLHASSKSQRAYKFTFADCLTRYFGVISSRHLNWRPYGNEVHYQFSSDLMA